MINESKSINLNHMQTRRTFLQLLSASAFAGVISSAPFAFAGDVKRPNIVILYADDMGYGDLGIQNPDSKIPTPNLDRLAREGMRFTDAHSSSGICTPSRYALLTGRHHWRKFHDIVNSFGQSVFDKDEFTMPEMLRQSGYHTACIGKWHLGWDWESLRVGEHRTEKEGARPEDYDFLKPIPDGPLSHGFEYYFGDDVPNFPPYAWFENDRLITNPTEMYKSDPIPQEGAAEGRPGPMTPGWKLDAVMPKLTEKAVEWIGKQKDSETPFFLYFPWTSPHAPIVPTQEFRGTTEAGPYGDFVHQSDWSAGQVLQALEANGFSDNTLVIFTCDNGPENYAYERIRNTGHRSMGPLRGLKRDIYEGGHRVPCVMRWPGVIEPGTVCDALFGQVDILATVAAAAGINLPDGVAEDSCNMLPLLDGENPDPPIRSMHIHNTFKDNYAIRKGDWVLINAKSGAHSKVPEWFDKENGYEPNPYDKALYNIREDMGERRNLIEERPDIAAELAELLREEMKKACK